MRQTTSSQVAWGFGSTPSSPACRGMLLERGVALSGPMVCHVTGGTERREICALKTLWQARKPRAEAPRVDLFEETCKKPARGPSVLCIWNKLKHLHPPPLVNAAAVNALSLHSRSCEAPQPRELAGHEHLPLPKANGSAITGAGQQLKIGPKAE